MKFADCIGGDKTLFMPSTENMPAILQAVLVTYMHITHLTIKAEGMLKQK